jgi:hypothetical protein
MVQNWKGKSGGFSRSRLGHSEHILPVKEGGNGLGLNRRRSGVAFGGQGLKDTVVKVEF